MTADREPAESDVGPRDPFVDDPSDPTCLLDALEPPTALSAQERQDVLADLGELLEFAAVLKPRGIAGVVVDCADCREPHYFGWALMQANLQTLLTSGQVHVHEPACAPAVAAYVSWDYARGFTDALKPPVLFTELLLSDRPTD